ncbi:two-component regulator propeller domain-containing protein [uncultured Shewanella sp.]|uniref:hybrid sensor histidine kinase/response regulator transcription factor n=1 Tax=uncultured Shewanella sp. TaxID=173975 RepID=UPI002636DD1A|nr:two-component regulator propeller domain-containing protein [uncultured Shewanella sp.]
MLLLLKQLLTLSINRSLKRSLNQSLNRLTWLLFAALLSCLCLLVTAKSAFGLAVQAKFSHVNVKHGLSQNTVTAMAQSAKGYLWLGTQDGLNRFDGYDVTVFRHDKAQAHSLSNHIIRSLYLDSGDRLWVGTKAGLHYYEANLSQFHLIEASQGLDIVSILEIDAHTLLLGSRQQGLFYVNLSRNHLAAIPLQGTAATDFQRTRLYAMAQAPNGAVWLGTINGLFILHHNHKINQIRWPDTGIPDPLKINDILFINDANAFIATDYGLYRVDLSGKVQQGFIHDRHRQDSLPHNMVNSLVKTQSGDIWLGTRGGLSRLHPQTGHFQTFEHQRDYATSLSDNDVLSLLVDKHNNLWVGTFNAGVNTLALTNLNFGLRYATTDKLDCLSNNQLYNVLLSSDNALWLAADNSGVHKVQWPDGPCTWYRATFDSTKSEHSQPLISSNAISAHALFEDAQQHIWFGTHNSAINRLQLTPNKVIYAYPEPNTTGLSSSSVRSIVTDSEHNLWLATDGGGLNYYQADTQTFHHVGAHVTDTPSNTNARLTQQNKEMNKADSLAMAQVSSQYLFDLAIDEQALWIATETAGLDRLDLSTYRVQNFGQNTQRPTGTPMHIWALQDDKQGHLWLGTQGEGLIKFNKQDFSTEAFTTADGLANDSIYALEQDNEGMLWLASNKGISKFNPFNHTVENYQVADGLQGNEFNVGSYYSKEQDLLFFVGSNGFNAFKPGDIKPDPNAPNMVINHFLLFNQPAPALFDRQHAHITLKQAQNLIGFEFAGIHYGDPSRHEYQYQLEGFDANWRTTSNQRRFATYTNLDAGDYRFKVKASNHHGVWSAPKIVTLTVLPPLWLTWWAKIGYVLISMILIFGLYRYRTASLRERNTQLEQGVAQRTLAIMAQKQEIEQLLANKTREFDDISHEFRTPLAVILGRVENRLTHNQTQGDQEAFTAIETVAKRLATMVDDVIDMGRTLNTAQGTDTSCLCLSHLCHDVANNMKEYAKIKKQHLYTDITPNLSIDCLPKAIEKMLNNLLSNAIKYTQEKGHIHLSLSPLKSHYLQLIIQDNGPGIAKQYQEKIFERFYRIADSAHQPGSGIGLALVQDVVKAHQGEIMLESDLGQGSCFHIYLPLSASNIKTNQRQVMLHPHKQHPEKLTPSPIEEANNPEIANRIRANEQHNVTPEPYTDYWHSLSALDPEQDNTALDTPDPVTKLSKNNPYLLVVEDNLELRALLIEQLSPHYRIIRAKNGRQGLQLAEQEVPHLVLSDINMPYMNGYQLVSQLKQRSATSHIPVILLTAKSDVQSRIQGFEHQADGYLAKPYLLAELMAVIDAQLNNRQRLQLYFQQQDPSAVLSPAKGVDPHSLKAIDKCQAFIEQHYRDSGLSVQDLANAAHLSERQLSRKFQAILEISPLEFITEYRLAKAREMLRQGHQINQVALEVGFNSANYFSRQYKKKYGVTPSQDKAVLNEERFE